MAKLTELLKAIGNKRILANESTDNYLAVLVRVDADFDEKECKYRSYDVQVVVCDTDGNVKKSAVLKADAPEYDTVEGSVEMNVSVSNDGVIVGISYYDSSEDDYAYHTETL